MDTITLSEPTIFPELNKQESLASDFARVTLNVSKMKYKHIRSALKFPEIDQIHHLMMMLTGLHENDLGELAPKDAAKLTFLLQESLLAFNQPAN